jgi:SAM-dependent methyltransferase
MEAVNAIKQDCRPEAIEAAARHALMVGKGHLAKVSGWLKRPPAGLDVLELGPGPDFGSTLTLAAMGARIAVADRWLPVWDRDYHGAVYRRLAALIAEELPGANVTPILQLVEADAHLAEVVRTYPDAETLEQAPDQAFDLVISNAVYEHIVDVAAASQRVFDVLRPGGYSIQQVDLRDHRNFDAPLDYLLMTPQEEEAWLRETEHHQGCQRRRAEYEAAFDRAGFEMISAWVDTRAEPDYMAQFLPRLRACQGARFQHAAPAELEDLGICYVHRRP